MTPRSVISGRRSTLRYAEPWNGSPRRSATAGSGTGGRLPAIARKGVCHLGHWPTSHSNRQRRGACLPRSTSRTAQRVVGDDFAGFDVGMNSAPNITRVSNAKSLLLVCAEKKSCHVKIWLHIPNQRSRPPLNYAGIFPPWQRDSFTNDVCDFVADDFKDDGIHFTPRSVGRSPTGSQDASRCLRGGHTAARTGTRRDKSKTQKIIAFRSGAARPHTLIFEETPKLL